MQVPGRRRPIPCLGCGYDITGLPREGVCPECALPLRDTLEDAKLLRSIEWSALCRIYLGIHLIAWLPIVFVLLLPVVWILIVLAALFTRAGARDFLVPVLCVAGGMAMGTFAVGCWLLGNRAPARSLHPSWARATTLWLGPLVAVLLVASPFAGNFTKYAEPWATLLVRAVCQLLTLVLLTAIVRLCQILEDRTQSPYGDERPRRHRFAWSVIVVLGFVWGNWYWAQPLAAGTVDKEREGWWGEGWALLALILLGTMFWRAADAVALEWNAARYNREEENFQD